MKIFVIGPKVDERSKAQNFTGVVSYYLCRELTRRGVELVHDHGDKAPDQLKHFSAVDVRGADHVLALGLRLFTKMPHACVRQLRKKVPGAVVQVHDGDIYQVPELDCTFTFRDDAYKYNNNNSTKELTRHHRYNYSIGWAADETLLYPEHVSEELRILIDHPYYKGGLPDYSLQVVHSAAAFVRSGVWADFGYKTCKLRRIVNGGVEDVNIDDPVVRPFDRQHIPFEKICEEYRKTNLFVVTHKESVGLTVLETAMCGAFVLTHTGLIYPDRLKTVRFMDYHCESIPWAEAIGKIDIAASRKLAIENNWSAMADRVVKYFKEFKRG